LPREAGYAGHVYHIYAVRLAQRDRVRQAMEQQGVGCGVHYPVPIHLQQACAGLGHARGSFPQAEVQAEEVLSLPIYPELEEESIEFICSELKSAVAAPATAARR
jgi:dTDP-4-amino-4,6-dideoxygalactose transaminase